MQDYKKLLQELETSLSGASTTNEAVIIKNTFIKKNLTPLYQELKKLPHEQKHDFGQSIN